MVRAVIFAGGLGTRLRPYTAVLPKPLMPIGDRPMLDILLTQLSGHGFERITISTGHLAELVELFCGDGTRYGLEIDYFREDEPLGTVGSLGFIEDLGEPFLTINGDVLTDLDYAALMREHVASEAAATVATKVQHVHVPLGVLRFHDPAEPDRCTGYEEKPQLDYTASMGVACWHPRVVERIGPGERLDFPDLIRRLIDAGDVVRAHRSDAYWLDIGRHEDYAKATEEFDEIRARLLPNEVP
jgi:NDP-sugar pyrophosphorylase family protein